MSRWPGSHPYAATLTFDFDAEELWIGDDPANAHRPGVLSQGTYSPKVAIPMILDLLAKHDLPATFFVPGKDAERHPDSVRSIIAAGHEIGHHGYTHRSPSELDPAEEEEELVRGLDILRGLGAEVHGYRSPSWDFSASTLDLLERHGLWYSSNLMDDLTPYRHADHDVVELCVAWLLDDAPHFSFSAESWNKSIRLPREVKELWSEEIAGIAALGGHAVLTLHPQIIGRPSRLAMLDGLLTELKESGAWIAPAFEVARLFR